MISSTRQLSPAIIHVADFQNNSYSFPVDSVLTAESVPGKMVISVSAGYLLITSSVEQPKREQSLSYKKQNDGRWAIHALVTILSTESELAEGSVRIRNPQAETITLTIQRETTALARVDASPIVLSETALAFGKVAPGQAKSLLFTVSQSYTNEPVTITSDSPEHFQLATDSHPNFTASLTIKPSLIAMYVHVRYIAQKAGTHTGQLLVRSAYDEHTIDLTGQTARFLPALPTTRPLNGYAQRERRTPMVWTKVGVAVVLLAIVAGLGWFGLANHQSSTNVSSINPTAISDKVASISPRVVAGKPTNREVVMSPERSEVSKKRFESKDAASASVKPSTVKKSANEVAIDESQTAKQQVSSERIPVAKPAEALVTKRPYQQARPVPATGESELEKELNQSTTSQP